MHIKRNLPQSSAGIGSKLNTAKFTLIRAAIIQRKENQRDNPSVITFVTPIGPLILFIASSLSHCFTGKNIRENINLSHSKVNTD